MECIICGSNKDVHVVASTMGAISESVCRKCISNNIENYDNMIAYLFCIGGKLSEFREDVQKRIIKTLKFYKKSIEEFESDLKKANKEYVDYMQSR